jgi:DNA-binding LacI/PurR family transcriptional regulator
VFNPLQIGEDVLVRMERTMQPTVFIGEHVAEHDLPAGCDYVRTDNEAASREATAHLIGSGRTHVAYLGALASSEARQEHSTSRLRLRGYHRAIVEAGSRETVVQTVPEWSLEGGLAGVRSLMRDHPSTDGLVCGNDDVARGALVGLLGMGIRVPEQVAVIGYDNTHESSQTSPPLTTIDPDKKALAATVLDLLIERIDGYDGPPRVIESPYRLVRRGSSG